MVTAAVSGGHCHHRPEPISRPARICSQASRASAPGSPRPGRCRSGSAGLAVAQQGAHRLHADIGGNAKNENATNPLRGVAPAVRGPAPRTARPPPPRRTSITGPGSRPAPSTRPGRLGERDDRLENVVGDRRHTSSRIRCARMVSVSHGRVHGRGRTSAPNLPVGREPIPWSDECTHRGCR